MQINMSEDAFVNLLEVRMNMVFTDEQKKFIKTLDKPGICFASPGTGKTASAVAGLLTTELYKQVPGENIYALSFTNMATLELSLRHEKACRVLGITQRVNFKTLHSLCSTILRENYEKLGMYRYDTVKEWKMSSLAETIYNAAMEFNIDLNQYKARNVVRAARTLNSSLTFARTNVESKAVFKEIGIGYDDFQLLRKLMYEYDKQVGTVESNNIMLYTLELLLEHPELSAAFKEKCKVLLVDEAQDLSLLQLRILSLLSDNLILIGDIKQQIYAFNGACQEIVAQYLRYFPDAWKLEFTQSFRCKNEIADFATKLIIPNHVGGEDFKGVGSGGIVTVEQGIDYATIANRIKEDWLANKRNFSKDILFLFRNNVSAVPVAEELFKAQVPFRINNYSPVTRMPVIKDLCALVQLAADPESIEDIGCLSMVMPELRVYDKVSDWPLYKVMSQKHCDIFEANCKYRDTYAAERAMGALLEIHDMYMRGGLVSDMFNKIYGIYYQNYLASRERFMEYSADHYIQLANYAFRGKKWRQFYVDELEKDKFIRDCNERRIGVRCFTFHAAKGLEGDVVYMLDCDEGILPNKSKLNNMIEENCLLDVAREIRNERSLVYVAATRAKDELHVHFNKDLATILTGNNYYTKFDMLYENFKQNYTDVETFQEFYRRKLSE